MGVGEYPPEYNRKIHGPYDPARYYGKPDTPFGQVKLGEIGKWFGRRNMTPLAMVQAVSRAWWRWNHKFILPRNSGIAGITQVAFGAMIFFYIINYNKIKYEKNVKYHW